MLHGKYRAAFVNTMMHMPMLIQYIFSGRCKPFGSRCALFWHLALLACRPSGLSHSGLLLPFRALHQSHYFLCSYHSKLARWAHLHRQWRGSAPLPIKSPPPLPSPVRALVPPTDPSLGLPPPQATEPGPLPQALPWAQEFHAARIPAAGILSRQQQQLARQMWRFLTERPYPESSSESDPADTQS